MTDNQVSVITLKEELQIESEEKKRLEYRRERLSKKLRTANAGTIEEKKIVYDEIRMIQTLIEEQSTVVILLEKSMNIIIDSIDKLQGIEKKVFYMHRFQGKSLLEISDELGYDYGYIRKISSKANKRIH